jgi:NodT family efflux transporter outer membrane factor (OMF) lipoprotein
MMKRGSKYGLIALTALLACVGCKVGPKYQVPTAPAVTAFTEQPPQSWSQSKDWAAAAPSDAWTKGRWWEIFNDPQLNDLEQRVDVNNQTLKSAEARYTQARALVRENRSALFPTVTTGASIARDRLSANQGVPPPANELGYGDFNYGIAASWEPDLWGRIHTMVAASAQNAQATAADLENARLSLHAELALDYFDLRSLDNERKILDDSVVAYQKALELTQNRYEGGAAPRSELEEARAQLEATRAQQVDVTDQRTQFEHAIAVLTGQPPEGFSIPFQPASFALPVIPTGIPSALLQRRPDIAAAERRVAAANSQVGLAHAAYYPQVLLSAAVGLDGTSITDWFSWPSRLWAVGPSVAETLFDGGRRRAVVSESTANYDALVADYRQNVLTSFQQVEDNLASLRILEDESARQQRAVEAARASEQLSLNRYKGGLVTYLEVVTVQTIRLQDERVAVDIDRRRMEDSVKLIRALGGGWNASSLPQTAAVAH